MEESVRVETNNLLLKFSLLQVSASGLVTFIVGVAVAALIAALAWRLVRR